MKIKQVLIVGNIVPVAIENYYIKYLNELGIPTSGFSVGDFFDRNSFVFRVRNRLGNLGIYKKVNVELLKVCAAKKPDIVWVFKGVEIYTETLAALKKQGIILINYNPDHPFIRTSIAHGGKQIEEAIPLYDVHFSYNKSLVDRFQSEFGKKSMWLPFGYELADELYEKASKIETNNKVAFVGNPDDERARLIKMLLRNKVRVDVFGHGWNKWVKTHPNLTVSDATYGDQFWFDLRKYRCQINIFRKHNEGSHNMRTFEIPAIGGIQIAPYSQEHIDFFEPEKEIFLYKTDDELYHQVEGILTLTTQQEVEARIAGRERSIRSNYSYKNRAYEVAQFINEIF